VLAAGSILWAIGSLYIGRNPRPPSALIANGVQMLAGGVALLALGAIAGELGRLDLAAASTRSLLSLLYLFTAGSLVGFTAYTYLLQVSTPAKVSTYAYVNPVVAVFLGWAFASEEITAPRLVAAAVILAGVAIITIAGGAQHSAGGARAEMPGSRRLEEEPEERPTRERKVASS
jgi:drug/metabolite transporter (DMT)-like permease